MTTLSPAEVKSRLKALGLFGLIACWDSDRGRDGPRLGLGPPPAQIRASATTALGSCLGF